MLETRTVFINSQQENGTICLVDSISPTPAKSDTLHRRNNRKQTTLKRKTRKQTMWKNLSLYFSAAAADNTSSAKSNITRRRNNRKQTTLKRNNRKNKQHKTKQYKRISPFINLGNFLCAQSITFHRKRESWQQRERERKNNHLQHLITNETEMNKCNRNYP